MISVLSFGFLYPIKWQINIVQPWKSKVLMLLQLKHKEKPILKTGNKAPCCGICICVLFLHSNFVFVFVSGYWMKQTKRLVEDLSYKCFVLNCTCLWTLPMVLVFAKAALESEYLYKKNQSTFLYIICLCLFCVDCTYVYSMYVCVYMCLSANAEELCWELNYACMYIYLRFFVFVYVGFPVRVFLASVRISLCVYLCTCVCVSADAKESGQRALSRAHATKHLLWETHVRRS